MGRPVWKVGLASTKPWLETLAALRRTEDGLRHSGGVQNFKVTKDVLVSVRDARTRYEKDMKQRQSDDVVARKRKSDDQIHVISAKIKRLEDESHHLAEAADKKALEAEKKESLKLMCESNALRAAAKQRKEEAANASAELAKMKSNV